METERGSNRSHSAEKSLKKNVLVYSTNQIHLIQYTRCDNLIPGIVAAYRWGVGSGKLVYSSTFGHVPTCIYVSLRPNESLVPE